MKWLWLTVLVVFLAIDVVLIFFGPIAQFLFTPAVAIALYYTVQGFLDDLL